MQKVAQTTDTIVRSVALSNFLVCLFLSISLNLLWEMVNCLQIQCHYPMFDLLMPANTKYFFKFVVTIATFDLIPTEGILSWVGSHIRASKV